MKTISFYQFETLQEAVDYFTRENINLIDVKIGGAFGGVEPTSDDDPVFIYGDE